jgi:hypothetical protein
MTSTLTADTPAVTIVNSPPGATLSARELAALKTRKEAAAYERFRAIIDDYEEPARPGLVDVVTVAGQVTRALGRASTQEDGSFQTGSYWNKSKQRVSHLALCGLDALEGRTFRLVMSPGIIGARSTDLNRVQATAERAIESRIARIDALNSFRDEETGELPKDGASTGEIWQWSAKSRSNMSKTLASLDYSEWHRNDGALAMVTLTLPGDWKPLAPNGKAFKQLVEKFRRRWTRAGLSWRCLWKLEFQRRGAPHWHGLLRVPALVKGERFETWLSRAWADTVGASKEFDDVDKNGRWTSEYTRHLSAGTGVDFSGKDFSDPTRIAMYFAGHSAKSADGKEYQHIVPAKWQAPGQGPGRFWGFCGLQKALVEVDVTLEHYDKLRRELRKLARARANTVARLRERGRRLRAKEPEENRYDPSRRSMVVRGRRSYKQQFGGDGGNAGGWVLMNDALKVVLQLLAHIPVREEQPTPGLAERLAAYKLSGKCLEKRRLQLGAAL